MTFILQSEEVLRLDGPTAVTIGKFDGVHLGHQAIVRETIAAARSIGGASVVLTFWPHPASVLRPGTVVQLLASLRDRLDLLAHCEPDCVKVVAFDLEFSHQSAGDFLAELKATLDLAVLVVGEDARLGRDRHAGARELREIAESLGVKLVLAKTVGLNGPVGSQSVRQAFAAGDLDRARRLLGRLPSYAGTVVRGDARGQELGFPTANVRIDANWALPARGVYAGCVLIGTASRPSLYRAGINLGVRPTFAGGAGDLLEAHLLDFKGELYGQEIRVYFERFLRPEAKFDTVAGLVRAMESDIAAVRSAPPFEPSLYAPWFPVVTSSANAKNPVP